MAGIRVWALALLMIALPCRAAGDTAEDAFRAARKSYLLFKRDSARRMLRHHWLNVAHRFESVASRFPHSKRAPEALFNAAEVLRELSRISRMEDDLQAALALYQKVCAAYPKNPVAGDSALALATLYLERTHQRDLAQRTLARALARAPGHSRVAEMRKMLGAVSAQEAAAEPPRTRSLLEAIAKASQGQREEFETPRLEPTGRSRSANRRAEGTDRSAPEASANEAREKMVRERLRSLSEKHKAMEATLPQQLGLKVHRVIIDAGHGGYDTGAIGARGAKEKDVALAMARLLRTLLIESGLEVVLTREADSFVGLEDRARLANEARGDLFISIHCNSSRGKKLRGVETYSLNTSSDRYSIRLAARENSSSEKGISDLQYILADLATKANTDESSRLAVQVQQSLVSHLRSRHPDTQNLGTKEALFYVLLGVRMPAVLVETSFLSNPNEEKLLSSKAYQQEVAGAIAAGIHDYLGSRQRIAKVN